jgi:pyridinium-3,5-bisthiocarboxylic acid mononucleotide nickel chelatase
VRIAIFDPFSGASGDMVLGALVECGLPLEYLIERLRALPISGYRIRAEQAAQHGIHGTRVIVDVDGDQPSRDWSEIRSLIGVSELVDNVRERALDVFQLLAEAEAAVHRVAVDRVHFHEVGALDSIIDVCGAAIGFEFFGLEAVYCGPLTVGAGLVKSVHGTLPIPAPATAQILATTGLIVAGHTESSIAVDVELLTPTGAAILGATASPGTPHFTPEKVGYGFGAKTLPWPNALRLWIGERSDREDNLEQEFVFETNVDDMNPQAYELLTERLFAAGALDVWMTPVIMKKGRPGIVVSAIATERNRIEIEHVILDNSTSLGVRKTPVQRTKAGRRFESVTTRFGDVRVKLKIVDGRVIDAIPEYDDCAAHARSTGQPLREIWNEAHRIAERFIGQRVESGSAFQD